MGVKIGKLKSIHFDALRVTIQDDDWDTSFTCGEMCKGRKGESFHLVAFFGWAIQQTGRVHDLLKGWVE